MPDGFSAETRGLDDLLSRLERMRDIPVFSATVWSAATSGVYKRVRGADKIEQRTAGQNIVIMRDQAKKCRDLSKISKSAIEKINEIWETGALALVAAGGRHELVIAAGKVAAALVEEMRRLVTDGELKAVAPSTQKRKDREGVRPGLPPLIRTGQLLRSLVAGVEQL